MDYTLGLLVLDLDTLDYTPGLYLARRLILSGGYIRTDISVIFLRSWIITWILSRCVEPPARGKAEPVGISGRG